MDQNQATKLILLECYEIISRRSQQFTKYQLLDLNIQEKDFPFQVEAFVGIQ